MDLNTLAARMTVNPTGRMATVVRLVAEGVDYNDDDAFSMALGLLDAMAHDPRYTPDEITAISDLYHGLANRLGR